MIKRKCKQCDKEFVLSDSEIKFFNDKNLELPKRCNACRKENKNNKEFNIDINWQEIRTNFGTEKNNISLEFRNETLWQDHFEKHGSEFGYKSKEEYLKGANEVINSSTSKHKIEAEDGDEIYYNEEKNEIVFVSKDGYIRTYFKPNDGINYYNRQ